MQTYAEDPVHPVQALEQSLIEMWEALSPTLRTQKKYFRNFFIIQKQMKKVVLRMERKTKIEST